MSGFVADPADFIKSAFDNVKSAGNSGFDIGLSQLWNDFNNISELLQVSNRGWVGSDPLFSHLYIFQPAAYKGLYLPRNLVRAVKLPHRDLRVEKIPFKGGGISHAVGFDVTDLDVTFYENQSLQTLGYGRSWQSDIISPGGGVVGLPNDYKYTMFFIYNNSLGNPTESLASSLINLFPTSISSAFNKINFCGLVVLNGCFPKSISYDKHSNMESNAYEINIKFNVDEMLQIPLNLDMDTILTILGLGGGALELGASAISSVVSDVKGIF